MTNIYLTDSDEKAIVDFVKDHEELYDKTNVHFKHKARKDCLWERFARSYKLSVKACKTWFKSQRTRCGKLTQSSSGQAPKGQKGRAGFRIKIFEEPHQCSGIRLPHRGASASEA